MTTAKNEIMNSLESDGEASPRAIKIKPLEIKAKIKIDLKTIKAKSPKKKIFWKTINKQKYVNNQQKAIDKIEGTVNFKYGEAFFSKAADVKDLIRIAGEHDHPMFLEICNKNVKLMADLEDYPYSDFKMIKYMNELLADVFGRLSWYDFNDEQCMYLVDDSKNKKSIHFLYNSGYCFENNGERTGDTPKCSQWEFWEYVRNIIFTESKYEHLRVWKEKTRSNKDTYMSLESVIDFNVYSKNRAMRMMKSYKCTKSELDDGKHPRTFYPCKIEDDKVILLKRKKLNKKYLINSYSPNPKYYNFTIESAEKKHKYESHNLTEIYKIINEKLDNVTIDETEGCMVKLRNDGDRVCLISGETHTGNNPYVVIRGKGLYFYCHWDECKESPLEDVEDDMTEDGGLLFHRFDDKKSIKSNKKSIISKLNTIRKKNDEEDVKDSKSIYINDLVYSDINRMLLTFKTETVEVDSDEVASDETEAKKTKCLTEQSQQDLINWMKSTVAYITDSGADSFYIKKRIYNVKTDTTTITWMKRKPEKIFGCKDLLSPVRAQFSSTNKITELGKLIKHFTHTFSAGDFVVPRYDTCTFVPYFDKKPNIQYSFNLFEGWYLQKMIEEDEEECKEDFEESDMFKHIEENICNGDKDLIEWAHHAIAHMIQKPAEKPEVCWVLYSQGGAGKDRFSAFLGALIGAQYHGVYSSLDAFTNNFNVLNKNKMLCTFNEVSDRASRQQHDLLKHIITQSDERIEAKGIDADEFPCFKRYIINTNYRDCIRVETDDRRYVLFQMNNKQIGDFDFFQRISDEIKDIGKMKAAFQYYSKLDLSKFNIRKIPKTTYKKNQQMMNIKTSYQFMINLYKLEDMDCEFSENIHKFCTDPDMKPVEVAPVQPVAEPNVMDAIDEDDAPVDIDIYDNRMYKRPIKEKHSYEFKVKDLYKTYKSFCDEGDLNSCKTPAFKQDMISLGLGDGRKSFRSSCFEYGKKGIRGYVIDNDQLKRSLEVELSMPLDE